MTEAPTPIAARMVVERRGRAATPAEIVAFRAQETLARQQAAQLAVVNTIHVVMATPTPQATVHASAAPVEAEAPANSTSTAALRPGEPLPSTGKGQ
jgi:hypothetical protein